VKTEDRSERPRFRSFRAKLLLLVALAVALPALLTCVILGFQLDRQARAQFANGLAANLETFSLILQDNERNLVDGVKRMAADNTLQVTLDLDMRSQLTKYIEEQRQVLGITFLAVYDKDSSAIGFSGGAQDATLGTTLGTTLGKWQLGTAGETGGEDCVAARYGERQLVRCNGTVYLVSAVLVFKAADSGLGDASGHDSTLLGYLVGGTPLAKPALIESLQSRQIAHPLIWVDGELIYANLPTDGLPRLTSGDGAAREYVLQQTAYLGAAKSSEVGSRRLVYGVMTPLAPLRNALLESILTVAGVGLLLAIATLIALSIIANRLLRPVHQLREGAAQIGAGMLDHRIDVSSGDELEALADQFNHMAEQLRGSYSELEGKVEERTRELRQRGAELRVTFDNMTSGVVMYDSALRVTAWNKKFQELLDLPDSFFAEKKGFSDYVALMTKRGEFGPVDAETAMRNNMERVGKQFSLERTRPNGTVLEIRHNPLPDGGFVSIYTDITERKQFEQALTAARDAAQEASRTKSTFLANMSHELRTPLNAIIGYSEILQEDATDKGDTAPIDDLQKIESAGRHLLGLINNILDLSKIEAGKMDVFIEQVDIPALLEEVMSIIKPLADKNENAVELVCPADIGSFRSDQTKVKQCLLNLLSNANKFTSKGKLTLTVAREPGSRLSFRVSDTGVGMTPEQLGRLFQAFSQADASTTKRFGGTGLGLAITKHFCTLLGGDVGVESTPGAGSTFTIWLPDQGVAPAAVESPPTMTADGRSTVLVVDDDASVRGLLTKTLEKEGYRVISAGNGVEALSLAREHRPQAITLDVLMPQMDGWAALKELKADPELRTIPVIMVTVLNERGMAIPLGATDFVTKPVDRQRLTAILREHCGSPSNASVLVVEDDLPTREALCLSLTPAWDARPTPPSMAAPASTGLPAIRFRA
jgi:signal transduction histidine kinase/CheY-like chemotaxis protein/HAMP domain-containing protein